MSSTRNATRSASGSLGFIARSLHQGAVGLRRQLSAEQEIHQQPEALRRRRAVRYASSTRLTLRPGDMARSTRRWTSAASAEVSLAVGIAPCELMKQAYHRRDAGRPPGRSPAPAHFLFSPSNRRAAQARRGNDRGKTDPISPPCLRERLRVSSRFLATIGFSWCRDRGSNPDAPLGAGDFKSPASASFAIPAW